MIAFPKKVVSLQPIFKTQAIYSQYKNNKHEKTRLDEHIKMVNRTLTGTFYLVDEVVSMK